MTAPRDPDYEHEEQAMNAASDPDQTSVADIMEKDVVTARPEMTVEELAALFREKDVSGMPVTDEEGTLLGIVTEGDLVAQDADLHFPHYIQFLDSVIYLESMKKFEQRLRKAVGATVADVMTRDVRTVTMGDSVRRAATLMAEHKINLVPVVDGGKVVGVVTRHDIMRSMGL